MNASYMIAAVAIGEAFAAQPAINGVAMKALGSLFAAATVSVSITLVATLIIMGIRRETPSTEDVMRLPWWVVLGGLIGVIVVAGSAAITPVTGAALFFVCLVAGQLIGAVLLDHFGAFGLQVRELSATRIAGLSLVFAGVALVRLS